MVCLCFLLVLLSFCYALLCFCYVFVTFSYDLLCLCYVLLCFLPARDGRTGPSPDHPGRTDGQKELVKINIWLCFTIFYRQITKKHRFTCVLLCFTYLKTQNNSFCLCFAMFWTVSNSVRTTSKELRQGWCFAGGLQEELKKNSKAYQHSKT